MSGIDFYPHPATEPVHPPRPEGLSREVALERLEGLEASVRDALDEISAIRRRLSEADGASAEPQARLAPAAQDDGSFRGASGRASLRGSPVDVLFHSTVDKEAEPDAATSPPVEEVVVRRLSSTPSADTDPVSSDSWLEGRAFEVEPRRASIFAGRVRLLGREHPDTLWAAQDLAFALAEAGEMTAAWRLATRLLEERTRLLGHAHPHTERARELHASIAGTPTGGRWTLPQASSLP